MRKRCLSLLIGIMVLIAGLSAHAEIPRAINCQGRLTDAGGVPVADGTYSVTFRIYADSVGGSEEWGEIHTVTTTGGLFNARLGQHSELMQSLFDDHADLFIGMEVSGEPEMPDRIRITSNAFSYHAFHAELAEYALNAVAGGGWRDDGTVVRLDATADSVGIGTSTPAAKLHVEGDAVVKGKTTFGIMQTNTGDKATISGGNQNMASGDGAVIGGGDSNTADSLLTTIGGGQGNYASGTGTTVGGGVANQALALFSTIAGGGPSDFGDILNTNNKAYDRYGTIGGGSGNRTGTNDANPESATHATVSGGYNNWAASTGASVGGGRENLADGEYATVAGGGGPTESDGNYTHGGWATISGGMANIANGAAATVGGGVSNHVQGDAATVGGGGTNRADSANSTVGGGAVNTAEGNSATVSGGSYNSALREYSTVAGGERNIASGYSATVGGGLYNKARGNYSVIAGGGDSGADTNSASGGWSTIGGGYGHRASGQASVISGGRQNRTFELCAAVLGGSSNIAAGTYATVGGGELNRARGSWSVVSGGGGQYYSDSNSALGICSTVPGGRANIAGGDFSLAAGLHARALHHGTFVWADSTDAIFQSTHNNQFLIRASGGVGIGTVSPGAMLDVADDDRALRLRAGNGQAEYTDNQILLSYGGTVNYSHAIKSRHSGGTSARNAIDFYVWDQAVDAVTDVGTKHVMTIDGDNNGEVGIGTTEPKHMLDVRGDIGNNGVVYHSDRRWKTRISQLSGSLEKIEQLRGVSFEWKREEFPEMNFSEGTQIGLIAQDVEEVLPELVDTDEDGYKSVAYSNLVAVLIEAVKEQQKQIDDLKSRLERVEGREALGER